MGVRRPPSLSSSHLSTPPSLPRSLPQAFCSWQEERSGWWKDSSTQRVCVRVPPQTWECTHMPAEIFNIFCTWKHKLTHTRPLTQTHQVHVDGNKHGKTWSCLRSFVYKIQAGGVCIVCQHVWICVCMYLCASVSLMSLLLRASGRVCCY